MMIDKNVDYYNRNADSFFEGSINADMSVVRARFLSYVPAGGRILDAGCGSGRDSKVFMEAGYDVVSFDASEEMCKRASEYIGREVKNMRFEEMSFANEFDGIWACASLLHVAFEKLPEIVKKLHEALRTNGAVYASFKYGEGTKIRGDRVFSDFTEESVIPLFENAGFKIVSNVVGTDSRPGREDEKWVNVICVKL
ncbi:class I SAM-dependent methyltransferase [Butyrivibrio sp. VCD2006]|uniref:class I SAM-dependent methyltransferase n=1 Tax=Butyrivibrio sp. VCD2006 TaxID=1280664 RepID=UPI0003FADBF2|nr:class I SAM-dependent methyltransferase [Butyrivibrio sp. VCD2006]